MNTVGGYFINNINNGVAIKENIISGKNFRFTILTERLVRIEYNPKGSFVDLPSERVIFRTFPKAEFKFNFSETLIQITTSYFTINYVKEKPIVKSKVPGGGNLQVILNGSDKVWYYGHPEVRNFGGLVYSLDDYKGNLKLDKGLYSTDGFVSFDDSDTDLINEFGKWVKRDQKSVDIYLFMYKKDFGLCLQDYYKLTGYPELIPKYMLGNWWYKAQKYNMEDLSKVITNFRENKIPLSGIMLSDKCSCEGDNLNISNEINPEGLKNLIKYGNVKLAIEFNPAKLIRNGTLSYTNIKSSLNNLDNEFNFLPLDDVKSGLLLTYGVKNYLANGIDNYFVNYNNIKDKNNLYKLVQNFYVGTVSFANRRTFVLSRNHKIAPHRNTIIYTGNTLVDWNTLEALPRYFASASNNGVSFVSSPIGGFYSGIENFELYIRYIQFGVFSPLMILASDGGKYYRREPWRWNDSKVELIRKYLVLRNKLVPYIYTEAYKYSKTGSPIVQPLYYKYPKIYDEPLYKNEYFFGSQMLVCPITKRKNVVMDRVVQRLFIPEGIWYELNSGKKYVGNKYYMSFYKDEDYPAFCREGSIIPMSLDNNVGVPNNMEIQIFPGSNGSYQLYEDDGISNNYKNGSYSIVEYTFNYEVNNYTLSVNCIRNQGILPEVRNYRIVFNNTKLANVSISSGGSEIKGNVYLEKNNLIVEIHNVSTSAPLVVSCSGSGTLFNSLTRVINDDIKGILEDLEIDTNLKEKIDVILFSDLSIKKKRIAIRKLKRQKLEPKFVKMFLKLLEYIDTV